MKLLLTRHGETDWNLMKRIQGSTDTRLNETGIQQAAQLAARLKDSADRPNRIYTSRYRRASQTAQIIADSLQLPCTTVPGLEEISFGLWEGLTWDQVEEQYPEEFRLWYDNRRYQAPPGGESYQTLVERVIPALQQIIRQEGGPEADTCILAVTHSAVLISFQACLYDTPFSNMARDYRIKNTDIIEVDVHRVLALCPTVKALNA